MPDNVLTTVPGRPISSAFHEYWDVCSAGNVATVAYDGFMAGAIFALNALCDPDLTPEGRAALVAALGVEKIEHIHAVVSGGMRRVPA